MKIGAVKGLGSLFLIASYSIVVNANSECSKGAVGYCYCVYEQDLQSLSSSRGIDQDSIKQRVSSSKKALDLCITGADTRVNDQPKTTVKSQNQFTLQDAQRRIDEAVEQEQRARESNAEARKVMKEKLQEKRLENAEEAKRKAVRARLERLAEVERLKHEGLSERERKEHRRQAEIERRKQEEQDSRREFKRGTPTDALGVRG